jgi:hypothetical protein
MARPPAIPREVATFTLDPAPSCPHCSNKVAQVRVDCRVAFGDVMFGKTEVVASMSLQDKTLTALPCGCLLAVDERTPE